MSAMEIKELLHTIATYASLHGVSGKQHHYDMVQEATAAVMKIVEDQSNVIVLKERKGRPTVIEWQGERFTYDSQSTFRGGVQRGKAHKT